MYCLYSIFSQNVFISCCNKSVWCLRSVYTICFVKGGLSNQSIWYPLWTTFKPLPEESWWWKEDCCLPLPRLGRCLELRSSVECIFLKLGIHSCSYGCGLWLRQTKHIEINRRCCCGQSMATCSLQCVWQLQLHMCIPSLSLIVLSESLCSLGAEQTKGLLFVSLGRLGVVWDL